jgi:hypothetical protein
MKKILSIALALVMLFALCACGTTQTTVEKAPERDPNEAPAKHFAPGETPDPTVHSINEKMVEHEEEVVDPMSLDKADIPAAEPYVPDEPEEEPVEPQVEEAHIVGGWANAEDVDINTELFNVFNKALSESQEEIVPIARLASQVVAGTNHCFFARVSAPEVGYSLVYIYQPLTGDPVLMNVQPIDLTSEDFTVDALQVVYKAEGKEDLPELIDVNMASDKWEFPEEFAVSKELAEQFEQYAPEKLECKPLFRIATLELDGNTYQCVLSKVANSDTSLIFFQNTGDYVAIASKILNISDYATYGSGVDTEAEAEA